MTRALVLGGGGPVGVGWQTGLITGLAEAGVLLGEADWVLGTSAGSMTGAGLTSGRVLPDMVDVVATPSWADTDPMTEDFDLLDLLANRSEDDVVPEAEFVAHFESVVGGSAWPDQFRCTAFDLETGQPAIWDKDSGVELHRAVASSCCIPGITEPVSIAGGKYIDGGARDMLNADLAIGHDTVIALSCAALDPPEGVVPEMFAGLLGPVRQRIDDLRSSGSAAEVVEPSDEVNELSGWGRFLMDFTRTRDAFDAGLRQGKAEAARLGPFWSG
jgi:NTE family protein